MKSIFFAFFLAIPVLGGIRECDEDPEYYRYLSGTIGQGEDTKPSVYLMPCDTMYINEGVTAIINKNTYLAFADPKTSNILIVKGNLIAKGTQKMNIRISSSLDTILLSPVGLKAPWWGIRVEKEGSLVFDNVMMYGSYIPIKTSSPEVRVENSIFFGGSEFIVDGADNFKLSRDGYVKKFNAMDYLEPFAGGSSTETDQGERTKTGNKENSGRKKTIWSSPWTYVAGGAVLAVGGVAAAAVLSGPEDKITENKLGTIRPDM